jgi:excisionase family DNA binding protein
MSTGYSIAQVAKQVGVSTQTIRRRVREGIIPAKCFGPKSTRIDRDTLLKLKAHGINGMPAAATYGYRS